jgi:hypothetical protein
MMEGPFSFRARFAEEVARGRARLGVLPPTAVVTERELVHLPAPVAAYLRAAGFVGKPQVRSYELKFGMRIRGGAHEPWMNGDVDQVSFADEPTRLFLLTATMYGLPVQALHHYSEGSARFQVRLGGFIPIVDAKGPIVDKTETVTLFNDMVMLAPGTLISPNIAWETLGDSRVKATFENGGHRISAELVFDSQGFPADFISDDRSRSSKDGKSFTAQRFRLPFWRLPPTESTGWFRGVKRIGTRRHLRGSFRTASTSSSKWRITNRYSELVASSTHE